MIRLLILLSLLLVSQAWGQSYTDEWWYNAEGYGEVWEEPVPQCGDPLDGLTTQFEQGECADQFGRPYQWPDSPPLNREHETAQIEIYDYGIDQETARTGNGTLGY